MEDLTEDERNRLKLGLTVPSNLRQPFDLGQAVRSLNSQGAVRGFQYNLFQLAEYYNDGIFNIMKLPKGVSLYHGSYNLANYLVFMPLGRTYFDTLYANGPSLQNLLDNGIVFQKSEKFWEEISSYGNPAPAWLSFLSTANLYSMDRAGELGRPVDCNDNKVVDLGGENLEVKKCVLAFETMREIKTVLLEDVLNITKILQYIEILTVAQWAELVGVLNPTEVARPNALRIRDRASFRRGISLMLFGPVSTDNLPNALTQRINFDDLAVRPLATKIDKFGTNFEFYNRHTNATVDFTRISMFEYDITTSVALCWLINTVVRHNAYDGMGNSWAYKMEAANNLAYKAALGLDLPPPADEVMTDAERQRRIAASEIANLHHPEFFFCNASACLKRNYKNPVDWQYQNYINYPPLTRNHFKSIDKAVFNYKTYKGDLIDISVWSGLITEALLRPYRAKFTNVPPAQMAIITHLADILRTGNRDVQICTLASFFITDKLKYYYCSDDNCVLPLNAQNLGIIDYNLNTSDSISIDLFEEIRANSIANVGLERANYHKLITVINMAMIILKGENDTAEKLLGLFYMTIYQLGTDKDSYNRKDYVDPYKLLVRMASLVAISFILQRLGPMVLKVDRLSNFESEFFSFLKNRSQRYPGKPEAHTIAALVTICDIVAGLVADVSALTDTFPQDMLDKAIQDNDNLFNNTMFCDTLYQFHNGNQAAYRGDRRWVARAIKANRDAVVTRVNAGEPGDQATVKLGDVFDNMPDNFWKVLTLAEYYCPLMSHLELSLKKNYKAFTSFRLSQVLQRQEDYTGIIHTVLDLTKPVYEIIFKEYVSHGYPILITNPPRLNHNILNLLRSLYFTNIFLEESSFAENKSLEPIDIFCIQLCSFLKSSGRLNEDGGEVNLHRFSVATLRRIFQIPNDNLIADEAIEFELNPLRIVTMCIGKTILESIVTTEIHTSRYYNYFILALGIAPSDPGVDQFNPEFQEFTRLISLGHYLDHCRPTTGFSQLDTEDAGNGRGPLWLKQLLDENKLTRTWLDTKKMFHKYQIQELEKSGFERSGNAIPPITESNQYRCGFTFRSYQQKLVGTAAPADPNIFVLTDRFMQLSNNFSFAWETLVVDN